MLYTKFQPNMLGGSGGKFNFSGLAIFSNSDILILDQPEFNHS